MGKTRGDRTAVSLPVSHATDDSAADGAVRYIPSAEAERIIDKQIAKWAVLLDRLR